MAVAQRRPHRAVAVPDRSGRHDRGSLESVVRPRGGASRARRGRGVSQEPHGDHDHAALRTGRRRDARDPRRDAGDLDLARAARAHGRPPARHRGDLGVGGAACGHDPQLHRRAHSDPAVDRVPAARRAPTRRYPYGYHRAEDVAGLAIVALIGVSAAVGRRRRRSGGSCTRSPSRRPGGSWSPVPLGFLGNEAVAQYRIRVGRRIGSAALVADGMHARTDGLTSLGVVAATIGVLIGFERADAIVGLAITVAIVFTHVAGGKGGAPSRAGRHRREHPVPDRGRRRCRRRRRARGGRAGAMERAPAARRA